MGESPELTYSFEAATDSTTSSPTAVATTHPVRATSHGDNLSAYPPIMAIGMQLVGPSSHPPPLSRISS